jgi:ABC-type molybdate transport system substrate-binding protein
VRRLAAWPAAVLLLAAIAACDSDPGMQPQQVMPGVGRGGLIVLMDGPTRGAVLSELTEYVKEKGPRVVSAAGSPTAIATGVKQGRVVDVVVLPAGQALDRVRDELVAPPSVIGRLGSTPYWVAPVTGRGLPFVQFLRTARGTALLRSHGFTT